MYKLKSNLNTFFSSCVSHLYAVYAYYFVLPSLLGLLLTSETKEIHSILAQFNPVLNSISWAKVIYAF